MSTSEYYAPKADTNAEQAKSQKKQRSRKLVGLGIAVGLVGGVAGGAAVLQSFEDERNTEQSTIIDSDEYNAIDARLKVQALEIVQTAGSAMLYESSSDGSQYEVTSSVTDINLEADDSTQGELTTIIDSGDGSYYSSSTFIMRDTPEGLVLDVSNHTSVADGDKPLEESLVVSFTNTDFDISGYATETVDTVSMTPVLLDEYLDDAFTRTSELTSELLPGVVINSDDSKITTRFTEENGIYTITNQADLVKAAPNEEAFEATPQSVLYKQFDVVY